MTSADVVARELFELGVRRAFGHPGGEIVELIEALETNGIEFVLTGHEAAAAFMAGVSGRLTGVPGVCLSTLGPGACNAVLGVASAWLDRDPLLHFSARTPDALNERSNKQNLPLTEVFSSISKSSVRLDGHGTAIAVREAASLAQTPPRGPVHLSLPLDVAGKEDQAGTGRKVRDETCEPRCLETILTALNESQRPLAAVGLALDSHRDHQAVRRFLAETGIPFVVLPQGKGVADEGADGFLGTIASAAGDDVTVEAVKGSDFLLGIGFDPVESCHDWHRDRPFYSITNGSVAFRDFSPTVECVGNVTDLLDELRGKYSGRPAWTSAEVQQIRERVRAAMIPEERETEAGLSPYHVMERLRQSVPAETILTTDVGAHKMLISQVWRARRPGSFLVSNGLSSMGFGLPASLAASLLSPDRPVVAVVGDGGFGMMVQELETAVRLKVKPLIVVLCDRSLAVIKIAQKAKRLPLRGVDFGTVDWAVVAEGFGAKGLWAHSFEVLDSALTDWLANRQLTVLAVRIDENLYRGLTY